ncbi:MAG: STAS domain-containing protein [Nitrospirae bacterium]|nr:STAS domain-containing protein [Nitrospirota bacterium]
MTVTLKEMNGKKIMALAGEIDMSASPLLRKELMALVKKKTDPLLIDFENVSYIDSSGIATFVEGLKGMMAFGGKLKLAGMPSGVKEIFSFSKLDRVFEIYGSIDDAINS